MFDAHLVAQARAGSRPAFDRLVNARRSTLLGAAYVRTGSIDDAEDLVQEALTRAWRKLPALEAPGAFDAWLRTIAANVLSNWQLRERPHIWQAAYEPDDLTPDLAATPYDALMLSEARRDVDRALAALPERNRLALLLHELDEQPYEEIARLAGVPLSTVDGRIRRAKAALRRALEPERVVPRAEPTRDHRPRRKPMRPDPIALPTALAVFTERLATFLEAGCPVARALDALRDAPAPYGDAAASMGACLRDAPSEWSSPEYSAEGLYLGWLHDPDCYPKLVARLNQAIEQKESLLPRRSQGLAAALARHAGLFAPIYVEIVRSGDRAGLVDGAVRHLAAILRTQDHLASRRPDGEQPMVPLLAGSVPPAADWADLTAHQQHATRVLLLRAFGAARSCGVPILRTMNLVAAMLPQPQADAWLSAAEDIKRGDRIGPGIERTGIFPTYIVELLSWGEAAGTMDTTAVRAAELLEAEAAASRG